MIILKQYEIVYILFYISIAIASYNTSDYLNLKRGLKRKSEDCSFEAKKCTFDTTNPVENLPVNVLESKNENSDPLIENIFDEYMNIEIMSDGSLLGVVAHRVIDTNDEEDKNKELSTNKLLTELVSNEKSIISEHTQLYNNDSNHSKNEEIKLLNSRTKNIEENLPTVQYEIFTTFDSEQNLEQQQLGNVSVYSYSNPTFLNSFLKFPSPIFTADSIRVRFGSGFLNFLSIDQLIRVLATLLSSDLELTKAERTELVETIFGHVDLSLDMNFNNDQIVSIVTALLRSDVPYCFEQVFLTWKVWKVFTIEEQEKMLEGVINGMEYKQETLVMLYLFVLNRDATNSSKCEVFKRHIIEICGGSKISNDSKNLTCLEYIGKILLTSDTLDTSLLDLPNVLQKLKGTDLANFKDFVRRHTGTRNGRLYVIYYGKRYKIHICYALTKFTSENVQSNNEGAIDICDRMYFNLEYIKCIFWKWTAVSTSGSCTANKHNTNEFRNAYGAMRQFVQNDAYDLDVFLKLFRMICITNSLARLFTLTLFSLTKEDIFRRFSKTPEWTEHLKNKTIKHHKFAYIENIFMYNLDLKAYKSYSPNIWFLGITNICNKIINANKGMPREHYLYQHLLIRLKFKISNDHRMIVETEDMGQSLE
ncbi:hypothetical protein PAEPH01_2199 [Pancytospora epiphaga]|nr:hypothetical protein PAEPH01_2199 [Pancytospora epiphaga]